MEDFEPSDRDYLVATIQHRSVVRCGECGMLLQAKPDNKYGPHFPGKVLCCPNGHGSIMAFPLNYGVSLVNRFFEWLGL